MTLHRTWEGLLTLQNYRPKDTIAGVRLIDIRQFHDDGGNFTELARFSSGWFAGLGISFETQQVNYSESLPGAIKAYHLHREQTDVWYVPPSDRMLVVLLECRDGESYASMRFVLGDGQSKLLVIPAGVAHGVKNIGLGIGRLIYFVDRQFTAGEGCDEGRLPWDVIGPEVWDMTRG